MLALKCRLRTTLVLLCLIVFGTQFSPAQNFCAASNLAQFSSAQRKGLTTWWPDPSTGLMWTGQAWGNKMNWKQASDYCAASNLGGFSGWRLPTLDELKAITYYHHVTLPAKNVSLS
jgi:hypothetical protein